MRTFERVIRGMGTHDVEFRVLGPLAVVRCGAEVPLPGPRPRLVLALLLVNAGQMVPTTRLVEAIWGTPARGTGPLRTSIWQLRRLLATADPTADPTDDAIDGAAVLVSSAGGYRLDVDRAQVDANRFEALFAQARGCAASGQPGQALAHLDGALALWHGPPFGDLAPVPCVQGEAARLQELLLAAKELRAEVLLATGQHAQSVAELTALARDRPERERVWALLMTALYRSGRQAEALRCFQEARLRLTEDMGIEPSRDLRALEQAILRQDPMLEMDPPYGSCYG